MRVYAGCTLHETARRVYEEILAEQDRARGYKPLTRGAIEANAIEIIEKALREQRNAIMPAVRGAA